MWLRSLEDDYRAAPGPAGPAELAVAKHRNRPVGAVQLILHADRSYFTSAVARQNPL